jgi:choline kinase
VIITGYRAEQIEAKIKGCKSTVQLRTIYNPFYEITNNLVSLWVAAGEMVDEDFVITNGDNIYFGDVFRTIASDAENTIQVTVDHKPQYDDDDMKVSRDGAGAINRIHKRIDNKEACAESVGLALIKGTRCRRLFVNKVLHLVRNKEYLDKFWLEVFNSLIEDGVPIASAEIKQADWQEVDFHPDVDVMRSIILKRHHE